MAGLQTIRSLRAKGFDVKVFEQDARVGGVWRENYVNFGVQVPKQLYEFLDFPFNLPWGQYPTGPETQQYIEDYVDHFQLRDAIETGTQVESVSPKDSRWVIKTQSDGSSKEETFDYCVIATGLYSKTKLFMPEIPNKEKFQGKVRFSRKDVSVDIRQPAPKTHPRLLYISLYFYAFFILKFQFIAWVSRGVTGPISSKSASSKDVATTLTSMHVPSFKVNLPKGTQNEHLRSSYDS